MKEKDIVLDVLYVDDKADISLLKRVLLNLLKEEDTKYERIKVYIVDESRTILKG